MMTVLDARQGYRLWAPFYAEETVTSRLDDLLVAQLSPPADGLRLLDAGCGTGRRLRDCGAASATGVDLSPEMLDAGPGRDFDDGRIRTMIGDIRALPLPDRAFDLVWCRLVIGHLPAIGAAYAELARVAEPGATLIVTDFHPEAAAIGHKRTFRRGDTVHELGHYIHELEAHAEAGRAAGLQLVRSAEARIGPEVWDMFARASRRTLYFENVGLPLVLGLVFRRMD